MSERFKIAFKATKLPKDKLAGVLGVSSRTLNRIESGEVGTVSVEMLRVLRKKFGTDLNWLIDNSDEMNYIKDNTVGAHEFNEQVPKYGGTEYMGKMIDHLEEETTWLKKKNDELLSILAQSVEANKNRHTG